MTGNAVKDPPQPVAFLNGADPQKRSLAKMARRPGDHSFRQEPALKIAALRALASICFDTDLRVSALNSRDIVDGGKGKRRQKDDEDDVEHVRLRFYESNMY